MFPEYQEQMNDLRASDRRFDHLCNKHAQLDQEIQMMQGQRSPQMQQQLDQLKKEKLAVKQSVYSRLQQA